MANPFYLWQTVSKKAKWQNLSKTAVQCPPHNWITLGQIKSDNINRMIQLSEVIFYTKTKQNENNSFK